ncbi:MAG TPA: hypothetical protein VGM18_13030 [Candidatus Sulfotelmatobacter sp.]|jgi:hypothetical protein
MPRFAFLLVILSLSLPLTALAENPQAMKAPSSSVVQVVYVLDNSNILTYDIDPQTLYATQVGTLATPASTSDAYVSTSPNGRFLYFSAYDTSLNQHLWIYETDATGSPQNPPVQEISPKGFFAPIEIDPTANFLYAVYSAPANGYNNIFTIERYVLDPATGKISQAQPQAKYSLPNGAEGTEECWVFLVGFNAGGTRLYDEESCSYHGGGSATYYERAVNPQTGALGPDTQVIGWNNSSGGGDRVQFVNNLVFDFDMPNDYQQNIDSVNIYPLQPNTGTPLVQCTGAMLQACGNSWGWVHPSGKYIFMDISQDSTQIDQVDISTKTIVDTGHYIPYSFWGQFSPDGTLVYPTYNFNTTQYYIEIFGFDPANANITQGGIIDVPSNLDPFFVSQRY